ncbi:sodium/proline symporter [Alteromonas lipolytica]|uniref:Sodium/proline symporter n=1 Tax=Alteromonas lipolytica TaxID=1856405 RepID=A0A1E8FBT7_9ALTE|nr:sodium/proline symporter [Alteromonas lipolytica]OFI33392.1 sodium:proline symporter [Alteromonas lipolytica]GGF60115.1 sodium:proline symporter [Alteromonas lipolytica]
MTTTILYTLIVYKLLLLAVGFWAQRRTSDTADYFLGGRQLGPVVASISYGASSASAWTLLGMSGMAYSYGLVAFWMAGGAVAGAIFAWFWIAPRLLQRSHAGGQLTLTEFITENTTSTQAQRIKVLASGMILFCFVLYISSQFQGAGNTFASTFDMDASESIILGGTIILIYTLLGGFWAVSVTDTLQGILMLIAAVLLPLSAWHAADGWQGISAALHAAGEPALLSYSGTAAGLTAVGVVVGGLAVGLGTFGQPHLVSRFMALRDTKALNQARWMATAWFALVFFGMCFLGIAGRALLPSLDNPETLFFEITTSLFPSVFGAVMVAAVLSAIMSTADSMLLVAAACVAHDLGVEKFVKGRELLISRLAMLTVSVAAIALAIALPASIFSRVLFAWTAIGAAFGPLLIAKLLGWRLTGSGIFAGMLSGFVAAIVFNALPNAPGDIAERTIPFLLAGLVLWFSRSKTA